MIMTSSISGKSATNSKQMMTKLFFLLLVNGSSINVSAQNITENGNVTVSDNGKNGLSKSVPLESLYGGDDAEILSAPKHAHCPKACASWHAGADENTPFVAMVMPSGVPSGQAAYSCYPPLAVPESWVICAQRDPNSGDVRKPTILTNSEVCTNLASLGSPSPRDGSLTIGEQSIGPSGDWYQMDAEIGCGWGSTYWHRSDKMTYEQARQVHQNVNSEYDCCMHAMALESEPITTGGKAVRFALEGSKCTIDREVMMRYGNLNYHGGLAQKDVKMCGTGQSFFWRHTAGSAEASNLVSPGSCQTEHNFLPILSEEDPLLPVSSIPHHFKGNWGNEFPNHSCPNWPYGKCRGIIGFNTIGDAAGCCDACVNLRTILEQGGQDADGGGVSTDEYGRHLNPCVAWQVVKGKCTILREMYITDQHAGQSVYDALSSRPGCDPDATNSQGCNYYSHLYYRETTNTDSEAKNMVVPVNEGIFADDIDVPHAVPIELVKPVYAIPSASFSLMQNFTNETVSVMAAATAVEVRASITCTKGQSSKLSNLLSSSQSGLLDQYNGTDATGPLEVDMDDLATLRLYWDSDIVSYSGEKSRLDFQEAAPLCSYETGDVCNGESVVMVCNLGNATEDRLVRRLAALDSEYNERIAALDSELEQIAQKNSDSPTVLKRDFLEVVARDGMREQPRRLLEAVEEELVTVRADYQRRLTQASNDASVSLVLGSTGKSGAQRHIFEHVAVSLHTAQKVEEEVDRDGVVAVAIVEGADVAVEKTPAPVESNAASSTTTTTASPKASNAAPTTSTKSAAATKDPNGVASTSTSTTTKGASPTVTTSGADDAGIATNSNCCASFRSLTASTIGKVVASLLVLFSLL